MANEMEPRPIDGGNVKQVIIEYIRPHSGARTYRGPSRREYRFSNTETTRLRYVLSDDVQQLLQSGDFRLVAGSEIDPEATKWAEIKQQIADELRTELADPRSGSRKAASRPRGRPSGLGVGSFLHCLLDCAGLRDTAGSVRLAYDAVDKYYSERPSPVGELCPRERFAKARSDGRSAERRAGRCTYRHHKVEIPDGLEKLAQTSE